MIKVLFFGDFVCQNPQVLSISPEMERYIVSSDVVYCNFEAPIEGVGTPISKSGPALTQSPYSPSVLERIGFNLIGLANNHMMDMGEEACKKTISQFKKATVVGAGVKRDAYQVKRMKVNDITLGFLSVTHKEFGTLDDESTEIDCGTAWISSSAVNSSILAAKKDCDYLFVLPHAGVENMSVPLPEWRFRYKEFVDLGADAVIASHPHIPQGWELYKGAPIFYSLGNFVFDSFSSTHGYYWNRGLAVQIRIAEDRSMSFEPLNVIYQDGILSLEETNCIKEHTKELCDLLEDETKYIETLNNVLSDLWRDEYQLYLMRGLGSVSTKASWNTFIHSAYGILRGMDIPMLLNNFQCESHRWAIERILKNKLK